jgi:proline racemase
VPSFVLAPGVAVRVGLRDLRVEVAFGGAFYAIVAIEAAGLTLSPARLPELRNAGWEIARAVEKAVKVQHPVQAEIAGIAGTVFTGPSPSGHADLASVTVVAGAHVDRAPSGTGTCALMAVLDAMGLLRPGQAFGHEGPIGTMLSGTMAGRTRVGEFDAILPEIEGSAWITGDHAFVVDDEDPLKRGFRL